MTTEQQEIKFNSDQEILDQLYKILHQLDEQYSTGLILESLKQIVHEYEENIAQEPDICNICQLNEVQDINEDLCPSCIQEYNELGELGIK